MSAQLVLAWVVPVAVLAAVVMLAAVDARRRPLPKLPTDDELRQQFDDLIRQIPTTPNDEPKAAMMLLEQSKISFDRAVSDRAATDTKAIGLVGLAAGATGASALFGGGKGVAVTPAILSAAILALVALGCLLFILRFKYNPQPNPASFVFAPTAWDQEMQFRMCLSLAQSYSLGLVRLVVEARKDRVALFVSGLCLAAATALVVANYVFPPSQPSAETRCSIEYKGGKAVRVECRP